MAKESAAPLTTPPDQPAAQSRTWKLVILALAAFGLLAGCEKVWDADVFWHLAAGDWMLAHGSLLGQDFWATAYDPTGGPTPWVNVHWLFQLIVAGLHKLGSFAALTGMTMFLLAAVAVLLGRMLRGRAGAGLSAVCLAAALVVVQARTRVRPEAFTFVFFVLTMGLLESARRGGSANRLFWLTPLMLLWVNMHSLFALGLALVWLAVAGAWIDRLLRRPQTAGSLATRTALLAGACATLACLVNPWPLEVFGHPIKLWTRIGGAADYYTYGVSELARAWTLPGNYCVYVPLALVLLAAAAMLLSAPNVPAAHWLWLACFAAIGATALRNTVFAALAAGPLAALWLSHAAGGLAQRFKAVRALAWPAAIAATLCIAALAVGYATGAVQRHFEADAQPGFGLAQDQFPIDVARAIAQSDISGDVLTLNFGDAGAFMYYGRPAPAGGVRNKVYMDPRLELHSLDRFAELYRIRSEISAMQPGWPVRLPPSVRFVVVDFPDQQYLGRLVGRSDMSLFYVGKAHACLVRGAEPPAKGPWPANLGELDNQYPLDGPGAILQPASLYVRTWYSQNPPTTHWRLGGALDQLSQTLLAVRYLEASERLGTAPPNRNRRMLARALGRWARANPIDQSAALPADPALARAMWLYARPGVCDLSESEGQVYDIDRIGLMANTAGLRDAAEEAMEHHVANLPVPQRFSLPADIAQMRNDIRLQVQQTRASADALKLAGLSAAQRAELLARHYLPLSALAELDKAEPSREQAAMRGDLLLRLGRVSEARASYAAAKALPDEGVKVFSSSAITMRLALCDWAEGDFSSAVRGLSVSRADDGGDSPADSGGSLAARYYQACLLEMLGRYSDAAGVLEGYALPANRDDRPHEEVLRAARQLVSRLARLGFAPNISLAE